MIKYVFFISQIVCCNLRIFLSKYQKIKLLYFFLYFALNYILVFFNLIFKIYFNKFSKTFVIKFILNIFESIQIKFKLKFLSQMKTIKVIEIIFFRKFGKKINRLIASKNI